MVEQTDELNRRTRRRSSDGDVPAAIEAQIAQTRAEMEVTIDRIQHRLSPDRLKRETKEMVRDATIGKVESMTHQAEREIRGWRAKAAHTVKENPVPIALIGLGLGWLIVTDNDDEYDDYGSGPYRERYPAAPSFTQSDGVTDPGGMAREGREWAREKVERGEATARRAADSVRERASDVTDSVSQRTDEAARRAEERARELGRRVDETTDEIQRRAQRSAERAERRARRVARRSKRTFWENMNENPLAVGAAAMTIGALVGLALPGTHHEDEWMGERRDQLVGEAELRARETGRQVRAVARETKDAAVETAQEETKKRDLNPATRQKGE